jgi:hypothetical protein
MMLSNPSLAQPDSSSPASAGIRDARACIAALHSALLSPALSPDDLFACVPGLSEAASRLAAVERELVTQPAVPIDIARDLKSLKSELRATAKLIEHGAEFHRGWARLLGSAAGLGYTSSGDAAPLNARGTVALRG